MRKKRHELAMRFVIAILGALAFMLALSRPAHATGAQCAQIACPPAVWVEQLDELVVAGQSTKLLVNALNPGPTKNFSLVIDCYFGGGQQDGHIEVNNVDLPTDELRSFEVSWTPWEPSSHACTPRVYVNPNGCYVRSGEKPLNVKVELNACSAPNPQPTPKPSPCDECKHYQPFGYTTKALDECLVYSDRSYAGCVAFIKWCKTSCHTW